jgi:hypothetical protein
MSTRFKSKFWSHAFENGKVALYVFCPVVTVFVFSQPAMVEKIVRNVSRAPSALRLRYRACARCGTRQRRLTLAAIPRPATPLAAHVRALSAGERAAADHFG